MNSPVKSDLFVFSYFRVFVISPDAGHELWLRIRLNAARHRVLDRREMT